MKVLADHLATKMEATRLVYTADDYSPIIHKLQANASEKSLVLVKGSRGMRLEKVVDAFQ